MKKHYLLILIAILIAGLILRTFKPLQLFMYAHDQDIASWVIRDVVENKHPRLIGQETSSKGMFIGPAFYYLLIPFYMLTRMDPVGGVLLATLIALSTILSFYFVGSKVFNRKVGLFASLIYALAFYTVFTDREVVPTAPAMLWSVWFFYSLWLIYKSKQKLGFLLTGILVGFIWHINLALALLLPLPLLALVFSRKRPSITPLFAGLIAALILSIPLIFFEVRHNFQQTQSLISALTTNQNYVAGTADSKLEKLDRTMQIVYKNTTNLFFPGLSNLPAWTICALLIGLILFLVKTKNIEPKVGILMLLWQLLFIIFFTLNPINISEYYLNGMNVIWIMAVSVALYYFFTREEFKFFGILFLSIFFFANLKSFLTLSINQSGYLQRKGIVKFIKEDSIAHGYPCVSVSYITSPGNDLGYRYLFYLEGLHVNAPKSGSPVYSIVFPHSLVNSIDRSFGALGLVLPDYARYNKNSVDKSCSGANSNLTDPVFGFTQ